jgi:hypothetical protein
MTDRFVGPEQVVTPLTDTGLTCLSDNVRDAGPIPTSGSRLVTVAAAFLMLRLESAWATWNEGRTSCPGRPAQPAEALPHSPATARRLFTTTWS